MAEPILTLSRVTKRFGSLAAVADLDLTVHRGDVYGFLGLNGAGKTTTIRMITGLVAPSAGDIACFGVRLGRSTDRRPIAARMGAMVEIPAFYPALSGARNLDLLAALSIFDRAARRREVARLLDLVGLADRGRDRVAAYSQGMRQRLGIAAALLGEPELVILDEPTNGLDPRGIQEVRALIVRTARERGATFFISSHLLSEVEAMCDRVGIIDRGRKVAEGAIDDLLRADALAFHVVCEDAARAARLLADAGFVLPGPATGAGSVAAPPPPTAVGTAATEERRPGAEQAFDVVLRYQTAPEAHALLVGAGVRVFEFAPRRRSLEDLFLSLTSSRPDAGNADN
ncbi:MAG: ABC transporter ATP-binding protein [Planctomycetes bacterium]|nr:ABC transporter ATP-binding protein [Planctomycetota bacterium]